jgi:hypothetical protein
MHMSEIFMHKVSCGFCITSVKAKMLTYVGLHLLLGNICYLNLNVRAFYDHNIAVKYLSMNLIS